ncbi:LLM class flavin-dependent oxidoreductase [Agromyces archimandritae]|uniref:LLM class flavin-dependent oxidoreductase n=1 Tax=Agromyces archimandritae TaxID=2781962 RepID=A0A975FQQ2_9MICO|nr:LLM class flavin-dependent oxidoreductase [Agromyces archimandritae]QTX05968.1 LLM class flavin-dependent oxidoreductase [Agromyces archimandritae]
MDPARLQFGTFITPRNDPPQAPVRLAELAEQAGFDLVTFQDHPYQPAFHDTSTLLTWVAARTERIHVAANVTNLPLRPPAVLARAAASLDLLSGGRFALGIGAGGFWDPIAAMGGRRLTPGQSVDALAEAIGVIRGVWDVEDRSRFVVDGEHYRIDGAKRGPAPAHNIPIWVGGYKPRMLRLIGRLADGWMPSLGYMQPGDFERATRTLDDAARETGRDPREIRRLVNIGGRFAGGAGGFLDGPAEQWIDQLLPYVLDFGVDTFILASDDPATMQRFAAEVAPGLREAVARESGVDAVGAARAAGAAASTAPAGRGGAQRRLETPHGTTAPAGRVGAQRRIETLPGTTAPAGRVGAQRRIETLRSTPSVARPAASAPAPIRSTAVRAKRREGIDYDAVPASLAAHAVEPGDAGFSRVRSTYMRGGRPGLVLRPGTAVEVADAVAFARANRAVPLGIRSGGHGISGRSTNDGGIVIDLGRMDAMEVLDASARLVRIEAGARWQDVAAFLAPHGWALSSGDYGGVGVGGLATAGGIGWLVREHGLTIDHVRAVELVLADGSIVRASADEHPELFWGVRGAGAQLGIATAFEFEVDEVGELGFAQLAFDASDTAAFLQAWGDWVVDAPRDLTSFLILGAARPGQPPIAQVLATVGSADPETIIARLQPLAEAAPLVGQQVSLTTYPAIIANAADGAHSAEGEPTSRSGLIGRITPEFARDAARFLESGATYFFQFRAVGGAVHDVPADATAFAHRDAEFSVVAFGSARHGTDERWRALLAPHMRGAYLSFDTEQSPEQLDAVYPPAVLERLRALKREVDPGGLFRDNLPIA